jgi:hypothetical protein
MSKKAQLGANALLHVIKNKKSQIVVLLLKHGVVLKPNTSDIDLALIVTNLAKTSQSFYNEFMSLLLDKNFVKNMYSNMDGFSYATGDLFNLGEFKVGTTDSSSTSDFCSKEENKNLSLCKNQNTTSSTTDSNSSKDSNSTNSSWLTTGLNLLQTGFNGYLQLDQNKTKVALANASIAVKGGDVQLAQLGVKDEGGKTKTSSNTALYVILGIVGVSVLGVVIYLATKKK